MSALIIGNSNMHPLDVLQSDPVFLEIASKVPGFDEVEERTARALAFELPDVDAVAVGKEQAEEYLRGGDATASVSALLANQDIVTRRRVAADLLAHIEGSARETAVRWYASAQEPVSEAYTSELERLRQEAADLFRGPLANVHGADDLATHPNAGEAWIAATRLALRFRALAKSAASMLGVSEIDKLPLVHVIENYEQAWPTYWIANGATIDGGETAQFYEPQRPSWADATPLDQLRALVDAGAVFRVPTPAGLEDRRTRIRIASNAEREKQGAALKREHIRKR
jgi:hypothetical protein